MGSTSRTTPRRCASVRPRRGTGQPRPAMAVRDAGCPSHHSTPEGRQVRYLGRLIAPGVALNRRSWPREVSEGHQLGAGVRPANGRCLESHVSRGLWAGFGAGGRNRARVSRAGRTLRRKPISRADSGVFLGGRGIAPGPPTWHPFQEVLVQRGYCTLLFKV